MTERIDIGPLAEGASAALIPNDDGTWGLAVEGASAASADQEWPVRIERADGAACAAGYDGAERDGDGVTARAVVTCDDGARFRVEDRWRADDGVLVVERYLTVEAGGEAGFGSALGLRLRAPATWPEVRPFVPGMLYGDPAHLPDDAIGSPAWWRRGVREVRIREDRLPAPLVALGLEGGASLALLHADPDGATVEADALSLGGETLTDGRFQFSALGVTEADGRLELGFWFPGTEGEVTYRGDTYPGGQARAWRRRYHPTDANSEQRYSLQFRVGRDEAFPALVHNTWRWAWDHFAPGATPRDLDADRQSLTAVLADVAVETDDGRAGFPSVLDATTGGAAAARGAADVGARRARRAARDARVVGARRAAGAPGLHGLYGAERDGRPLAPARRRDGRRRDGRALPRGGRPRARHVRWAPRRAAPGRGVPPRPGSPGRPPRHAAQPEGAGGGRGHPAGGLGARG